MPIVNLLPERLVVTQTRRRHLRRWTIACVLAMALLSLPVGLDWYRNARADELSVEFQVLATDRGRAEVELTDLIAKSRETYLQLERAKALRTKRSWSGMITLLAETMPKGCWLVELSTDPPAPSGHQAQAISQRPSTSASGGTAPATVVIDAPRILRIIGLPVNRGIRMRSSEI